MGILTLKNRSYDLDTSSTPHFPSSIDPCCWVGQASDLPRSADLKKAIGDPIIKKKKAMCDLRGKIQAQIDSFEVPWSRIEFIIFGYVRDKRSKVQEINANI